MRHLIQSICLLAAIAFLHPTSAFPESVVVEVGVTQIQVPVPKGFRDLSRVSPETWEFLDSAFTPPSNRLLAYFVTEDDYSQLFNGNEPDLLRSVNLQVLKTGENDFITSSKFVLIASDVKKQQNTLLSSMQEEINAYLGTASNSIESEIDLPIALSISDNVPLGVFFDWDDAFGIAYLVKVQTTVADAEQEEVIVVACTFMRVRNKILYGYVNSEYRSSRDIIWAKQIAELWTEQVLMANR